MNMLAEFVTDANEVEEPESRVEPGVWIFIIGDMSVFAMFFSTFAYYRSINVDAFRLAQQDLNLHFGLLNTLLLLCSSLFVVMAIAAARRHNNISALRGFSSAFACGLGFVVVKFFEYREEILQGHTLISEDFFMYYFIFTGIHLLHLLIGLGVLTYMMRKLTRQAIVVGDLGLYESGACYWHMVDLLWIVLFPLLYLLH